MSNNINYDSSSSIINILSFIIIIITSLLTIFKNKFRKIENLTKKCVNLEGAIKFNKTCLNNRIYPVHVNIIIIYRFDYLNDNSPIL